MGGRYKPDLGISGPKVNQPNVIRVENPTGVNPFCSHYLTEPEKTGLSVAYGCLDDESSFEIVVDGIDTTNTTNSNKRRFFSSKIDWQTDKMGPSLLLQIASDSDFLCGNLGSFSVKLQHIKKKGSSKSS